MPYRKFDGWIVPEQEREKTLRRVLSDRQYLDYVMTLCPRQRVAVQAGGYVGIWPKRLAETFAAVYTFEPEPASFASLVRNTMEISNLVRFQAALGFDRKLIDLVRVPTMAARSYAGALGDIPTLRVDDLGLQVCDLIYLDTEGMEHQGLLGAYETIRRCRPVVAIEEQGLGPRWFGEKPGLAVALMEKLGYRVSERIGVKGIDIVFLPA